MFVLYKKIILLNCAIILLVRNNFVERNKNNVIGLQEIISLFLIISVGIYASKRNIITKEINKGLTDILMNITMPLLIVSSFNIKFTEDMKSNIINCFFYSFATVFIVIILSNILLKPLKKKDKYLIQFSNVFSNCGFMGFPVIEGLYGGEGLIYASIFNVAFTILIWTYGVSLFTGDTNKDNIKKVLKNPSIIAVFIGLIMMGLNIKLPSVVMTPIEMVGNMTSALSMIIIGVILSHANFKEYLKDLSIYYGILLKLIVIPLVIYLIFKYLAVQTLVIKVITLLHAMPSAAMLAIFAENFESDKEYASVLMFMTTMCSIITFPIILFIVT